MNDNVPENQEMPDDNIAENDDAESRIEKIPDIVFEGVPEEHKSSAEKVVQRFASLIHYQEQFSGPIPPPKILKGYEDITSGSANRIISMAEKEQEHRHSMEKSMLNSGNRREELGLWFGFVLAMTLGLGGIYLISIGRPVEGFVAIIAEITTLVGAFILAQREKRLENVDQDQSKQLQDASQEKE